MSTELAKKDARPPALIDIVASDGFKQQMALVLPKHVTADRMARIAVTLMRKVPKLRECSQESLLGSLMSLSQFGLEPDGRRAHLIPYGRECTVVIDYKGYAELAKRSGYVRAIYAREVCEEDFFEFENGVVTHKIDFQKPRGRIYAFCAQVQNTDGSLQGDVMTLTEVEGIRQRSRAKDNGPWSGFPIILKGVDFEKMSVPVQDAIEMGKKSVFKRLSKLLVLSAEFRDAIEADDDAIDATGTILQRQTLAELVSAKNIDVTAVSDPEPKAVEQSADSKPFWFEQVSGCKVSVELERKLAQFNSVRHDIPDDDVAAIVAAFDLQSRNLKKS